MLAYFRMWALAAGFTGPSSQDALAAHSFLLPQHLRQRGIAADGRDMERVIAQLESGKPISIGMLGASVGQNAGCISQPGRRCMNYRGVDPVGLVWGKPAVRPFKGFLVRWFELLNATWPHRDHVLLNGARDATPISATLPCMHGFLPPGVDVVFIDVGSMASDMLHSFRQAAIEEVVRQLASLRPRPAVVFVTVALWCTCKPFCRRFGAFATKLPNVERFALHPDHKARRIDPLVEDVCRRYGVSCLSMRAALEDSVQAKAPGFSFEEVAGDCLHPVHGTKGVDYVTDVVVHWTQQARSAFRAKHGSGGRASAEAVSTALANLTASLPEPASEHANKYPNKGRSPKACYLLEGRGSRGTSNGQRLLSVPWHTAHCPAKRFDAARGEQTVTCRQSAEKCAGATARALACSEWDGDEPCPKGLTPGWAPRVWLFCSTALGGAGKESPGVLAIRPGATLFLPLDLPHATATGSTALEARLVHLVSYVGMGVVRVLCLNGCTCDEQRLDAHSVSDTRNVSVFREARFELTGHGHQCLLALRVSHETSSNGHKFKVRQISVSHLKPAGLNKGATRGA